MDVNVLGLSTLRKRHEKPREKKTDGSNTLQAYLAEQYGSATAKKKKKKKKIVSSQGLAIVDADIDTSRFPQEHLSAGVEDDEDAPVVVNAGEFQRIQLQEQRQKELLEKNGMGSLQVGVVQEQSMHGNESLPRRQRHDSDVDSDGDVSPPRRQRHDSDVDSDGDASPPRRPQGVDQAADESQKCGTPMSDGTLTGMISGRDLKKEMEYARRREREKFNQLDDTVTGKNALTVYRSEDGRAMSKNEYLDGLRQKKEQEKKFIQGPEILWGKGLRQSKDIRDSTPSAPVPSRWDDPMAHVLSRKQVDLAKDNNSRSLLDKYAKDLKKAGFNVPLEVPQHSWLNRNLGPPPNRYGIKPGRHWDGVDRSNGFESQLFKRQGELKQREIAAHYMAQEDM